MKHALLPLAAVAALSASALSAQTVYLDETYENGTIGSPPANASLYRIGLATVADGTATIGSGNLVRIDDASAAAGAQLEYNVGASALGGMFVQFDLFNNDHADAGTGSGTNPMIFGVANWSTSAAAMLNSNAARSFGLEFSGTGSSSTLKIRVGGSAIYTSTYAMSAVQNVKIFINDHDTNTLDYLLPGSGTVATLGANSAVIFINDALVDDESSSGFVMSTVTGTGNTTGDATLGRLGFNTSSTTLADFSVDNLYVSSVPSTVPEPSSFALIAGVGILGFVAMRRRRRA